MLIDNENSVLASHLPQNTIEILIPWINLPHVELKIAKHRSSKLGDYRPLDRGKLHVISVNGSLNKYAFFLTLVHEIAHMHNYIAHKGRVKPHGQEWKIEFQKLMQEFDMSTVFPDQLLPSIVNYLKNPKASSGADLQLSLALRNYNLAPEHGLLISEIKIDAVFMTKNGRTFIRGPKQRKRYKCKEVKSGRLYLFNPITEVMPA